MVSIALSYEEMISPEWLTSALGERHPGVEVGTVELEDVVRGVGTKALLDLEYKAGGDDLPTSLCAKAGWEEINDHLLKSGTYYREARFYREIAPTLDGLRIPACYYAGYEEGGQGILLLENLRRAGVTFGSAEEGLTADQAASFMEGLAVLHARYWNTVVQAYPWIGTHQNRSLVSGPTYPDRVREHLAGPRREVIAEEMRDPERLLKAAITLVDISDEKRLSLIHGDCHTRNLYLTAEGDAGFLDFQTVRAGHWAADVAYLLGSTLPHETRRASLEDLLRHYRDHLAARVDDAPSWDEVWLGYRQQLVYGYYMWAITREAVQPMSAIRAHVERLSHATLEAESYEALGV